MFKYIKRHFNNLLLHPQILFWFYILVNLIPSLFLLSSEPYNLAGKAILISFPLSIYLILFSSFKNNGAIQLLFFPLLFLHAFQLVLFYLYGEDVIAVDMFLNLVTTTTTEASELLNSIWVAILFVCVLYLPTTLIAFKQWRKKSYLKISFRKKSLCLGFLLLFTTSALSFYAMDKNTQTYSFYQNVYPVNVLYNLNFAINKWKRSNQYELASKDFSFQAQRDSILSKREIYVFVIGETARADNWSLYGYSRDTNPKLKGKENLVFFRDAITQSNTTHKSVSIMLSSVDAENYNAIYSQKGVINAFKEVGFKTVFFSNQGVNNTFTDYFAKEADIYKNIRYVDNNLGITLNPYDEELLPLLKELIDNSTEDLFVVFHTYGSHFNYKERYPESFSRFKPDNVGKISRKEKEILVNAYDNTILYTDDFLSRLTSLLESSHSSSVLLYSSDHGEDLLDDERERFLHASPNPTYYQLKIPLLLWFSPEYIGLFPSDIQSARENSSKPVATNAIFHTLLDMARIKTVYLEEDLSLVNPRFKSKKRMYLSDHDNPIPYYKMNLKKQDIEMLDKRGMQR